jgi:hypothetical protein
MAGQLIPLPGHEPTLPPGTTAAQRVAMWLELTEACDELLISALRRRVGPNGDLKAAYAKSYDAWRQEHDRALSRMLRRLQEADSRHAE